MAPPPALGPSSRTGQGGLKLLTGIPSLPAWASSSVGVAAPSHLPPEVLPVPEAAAPHSDAVLAWQQTVARGHTDREHLDRVLLAHEIVKNCKDIIKK